MRLQQKIYTQLQAPKKKRPSVLKEVALIGFMTCIALFLFVLPQLKPVTTAAGEMKIYTAFGGEAGRFHARASMLYTGVYHEENEQLLDFFAHFDEHMTPTEGRLGMYIVDILVLGNGEVSRYQMSESYLLDVDTGIFYKGDAMYEAVFNIAYTPHNNTGFALLMPVAIIILQGVISNQYKKRKIKFEIPLKYNGPVIAIFLLVMGFLMFYHYQIGPLFKPVLFIFPILFAVIMWKVIKKLAPSSFVYKMEMLRVIVAALLLTVFLMTV